MARDLTRRRSSAWSAGSASSAHTSSTPSDAAASSLSSPSAPAPASLSFSRTVRLELRSSNATQARAKSRCINSDELRQRNPLSATQHSTQLTADGPTTASLCLARAHHAHAPRAHHRLHPRYNKINNGRICLRRLLPVVVTTWVAHGPPCVRSSQHRCALASHGRNHRAVRVAIGRGHQKAHEQRQIVEATGVQNLQRALAGRRQQMSAQTQIGHGICNKRTHRSAPITRTNAQT